MFYQASPPIITKEIVQLKKLGAKTGRVVVVITFPVLWTDSVGAIAKYR